MLQDTIKNKQGKGVEQQSIRWKVNFMYFELVEQVKFILLKLNLNFILIIKIWYMGEGVRWRHLPMLNFTSIYKVMVAKQLFSFP